MKLKLKAMALALAMTTSALVLTMTEVRAAEGSLKVMGLGGNGDGGLKLLESHVKGRELLSHQQLLNKVTDALDGKCGKGLMLKTALKDFQKTIEENKVPPLYFKDDRSTQNFQVADMFEAMVKRDLGDDKTPEVLMMAKTLEEKVIESSLYQYMDNDSKKILCIKKSDIKISPLLDFDIGVDVKKYDDLRSLLFTSLSIIQDALKHKEEMKNLQLLIESRMAKKRDKQLNTHKELKIQFNTHKELKIQSKILQYIEGDSLLTYDDIKSLFISKKDLVCKIREKDKIIDDLKDARLKEIKELKDGYFKKTAELEYGYCQEINALKNAHLEKIEKLEKELENAKEEINALKYTKDPLKNAHLEKIKKLEKELENAKEEIDELENAHLEKIEKLKNEYIKGIEIMAKEKKEIESQNTRLMTEVPQLQDEVTALKQQLLSNQPPIQYNHNLSVGHQLSR